MNMALLVAGATAFTGAIILLWLAHKYPYQDKVPEPEYPVAVRFRPGKFIRFVGRIHKKA